MKTSNYRSSQKCPTMLCINARKNPSSSYQHMFLEDFCHSFSIDLAIDKDDRFFYDVLPEQSPLKRLLTFKNYNFLEYDLDRLFSHILRTLVFAGKASVEIVLSYDDENKVVGISLVPFDPILSFPGINNTYYIAIQHDGKPTFFKLNKRNIITFRVQDLGFRRYYLKHFYNRLPHFDVLSAGDMSLSPQKTGFDFSVWNDKREYKLLKVSRKTGWHGRGTDNPYMGDAYLLYRAIQRKSLRRKILDYFVEQINSSLSVACKDVGGDGTLIAKRVGYDYDLLLQKLNSGEINYDQLGDCIFQNKDILKQLDLENHSVIVED